MLNNVNACRLFYPDEIDDKHQWLPELKAYTNSIVAYEGLRYEDLFNKPELKGVHPVALGDGPNWNPNNPKESMFSLYSTSPVGILGAMVDTTDITGILRLNCNTTDFYAEKPYPVYLYYNPHSEMKTITYHPTTIADVFDIVSKEYVARGIDGATRIEIPANQARVLTELPAKTRIERKNNRLIANGHVIAYQ
jgi:hypothetical protein